MFLSLQHIALARLCSAGAFLRGFGRGATFVWETALRIMYMKSLLARRFFPSGVMFCQRLHGFLVVGRCFCSCCLCKISASVRASIG